MAGADFSINVAGVERLQQAMQSYQGDTEATINDVLHNEAGNLMQESIRNLIPVSGKHWNGKRPAAKNSKSLRNIPGNLSITVTTTKDYQYLYFPDDGSNTRRHVGNQQFFWHGGEKVQDNIVERCVNRLITNFENEV